MWDKIKNTFINIITNENSIEYKIRYLKTINIDPYTNALLTIEIETISKDIIEYTKEITSILNSNYTEDYIVIKKISENKILTMSIAEWFTDNHNMIYNKKEVWLTWLICVDELLILFEHLNKSVENYHMHGNAMRINPYIFNVKSIINTLYEYYSMNN